MTERKEPELRREDLVSVWNAPDEPAATAVRDFLISQGIEAAAVPVQIAWLGGVETLHHGYWGKVEVLSHDAERARALVEDFLSGEPDTEAEEEADAGDAPEGAGS